MNTLATGVRVVVQDTQGDYPNDSFEFPADCPEREAHELARELYADRYGVGLDDGRVVSVTPF